MPIDEQLIRGIGTTKIFGVYEYFLAWSKVGQIAPVFLYWNQATFSNSWMHGCTFKKSLKMDLTESLKKIKTNILLKKFVNYEYFGGSDHSASTQ